MTSAGDVWARAWVLLAERIQDKTAWGRTELALLMGQCLTDVLRNED